MSSLQQNWRTRGQNRFCPASERWGGRAGGRGEMAQTMYTHMNKCKNSKKGQSICEITVLLLNFREVTNFFLYFYLLLCERDVIIIKTVG
jgi:hypothetical protein